MEQRETIVAMCETTFPDRTDLQVASINPLESKSHALSVFRLKTADHEKEPILVRRYGSPLGWHQLEREDRAAREHAILNHLHGSGIPVPRSYGYGSDPTGEWLLLKPISGRNWWLPLGLVDFNRVLPAITREHVSWMVRLHALPTDDLTETLPVIRATEVLDYYQEIARFAARADVNEGVLKAALRRVGELLATDEEQPTRLIHGDAEIANVIVDADRNPVAWLDWDQAAIGDPRWDVALLIDSLRGGYQMDEVAVQALNQYQAEAIRKVTDLEAWLALVAVIRWTQCAWLKTELDAGRTFNFPSLERFVAAYDSHRAWAMEMLDEAEADEEDE